MSNWGEGWGKGGLECKSDMAPPSFFIILIIILILIILIIIINYTINPYIWSSSSKYNQHHHQNIHSHHHHEIVKWSLCLPATVLAGPFVSPNQMIIGPFSANLLDISVAPCTRGSTLIIFFWKQKLIHVVISQYVFTKVLQNWEVFLEANLWVAFL